MNVLVSSLSYDYHLQQEKGSFNPRKKENERYAASAALQEVKDSGTGLVDQVAKFHRRFK